MLEPNVELMSQRIDQVIDAIEREDMIRAVDLVRGATGATERQAKELVLTMLEGWEEAEARGLLF